MNGSTVIAPPDVTRNVYPSAGDLATASAPIAPFAPGRFSTTTGCLIASETPGAMARASVSATPPGGKLTINLTGLSGQVCAPAGAHSAQAAKNATALRRAAEVIDMVPPIEVGLERWWSPTSCGESVQAMSTSTNVGTGVCSAS